MALLTESLIYDILAVSVAILAAVVTFFKWRFQYWNRIGLLNTLDPTIPFGDCNDLFLGKVSFGEQFKIIYDKVKSKGLKHGGVYMGGAPFYIPVDPEIVKNIMQKDFQHFVNHGNYINEEVDPLSGHLFNLEDAKWRNLRVKLTPTFTSGKMKMMFQTLVDCTAGLKIIMDESALNHTSVDIKDILGRFTTDIIGSVAFGLECNSLKDPDALFRKYGKMTFDITPWERVKFIMQFAFPRSVLKWFKFRINKPEVEQFFMKAVKDTVNYREKNNIYRKDFMHLLLQLKNRGKVTDDENVISENGSSQEVGLTMTELSAQAFVFFLAGFETSSTTMTFALYELATNPHVQDKLRKEINTVLAKHNNQVTYEAIMEMTYMDQVLQETLRKYPPVPVLTRRCNATYTVPGTNIVIENGVDVGISAMGIQNDPEYYPNPSVFDPERFTEENKNSRPAFTWLPFGEGPRICIGLRFGLMQSKVGITSLLKNYTIKLSPKTHTPIEFEKSTFVTSAEGGIWLDVEKSE